MVSFYEVEMTRDWRKTTKLEEQGKTVEWAYNPQHVELGLALFGNTYPVKEQLKKMGFKWQDRRWKRAVKDDAEAIAILDELAKICQLRRFE
jgi:hypothetical protein